MVTMVQKLTWQPHVEHKHKNTRTSSLIHPQKVEKQYH